MARARKKPQPPTTPVSSHGYGLGWVPDSHDPRDLKFEPPPDVVVNLPEKTDLRPGMPEIYQQGHLGACTSMAIAAAVQYGRRTQGLLPDFIPSRLTIYWLERQMEGTTAEDAGAMLRDGLKVVAKYGVCPEDDWPYDIAQFARKPPAQAFLDSMEHRIAQYESVYQRRDQIQAALAANFPVPFGILVHQSMMTPEVAQSGDVPMPGADDPQVGGHAILLVGYDNATRMYLFRNSWGTGWSPDRGGYGRLPYDYVEDPSLASDMWICRVVG